jgi:hypothetical protein
MKAILMAPLLLISSAVCQDAAQIQVRSRVVSFCETEFNGDDANRVAFFKSDLQHKNAVSFASEPVDVVTSYKLISINTKGNHADVVVEYDLIARFENVRYSAYPGAERAHHGWFDRADKLVLTDRSRLTQTIPLARDPESGEWFIARTLIPKVSKTALIRLLQDDLEQDKGIEASNQADSTVRNVQAAQIRWNSEKIKLIGSINPSLH